MKNIYYSIAFYIIIIIKTIIIGMILPNKGSNPFTINDKSFVEVIITFFFVSIIETLLFNFILNKGLSKISFLKRYEYIIIFISSILFGASHLNNLGNIKFFISSFLSGIFYNINFYLYWKTDKKVQNAIISTSGLHFAHNLTIYLIDICL